MLIGRLGVLLLLLVSIAVIVAPCRNQIFSFIGLKRQSKTWEHVLVTCLIYSGSAGVAIIYP